MSTDTAHGLINLPSKHSVEETLQKLESLLQEKNITIFARVDHSGEAAKIGMEMRPTKLLLFGNPKGGTPLMQADQQMGIDLPLKVLVYQDTGGKVSLAYNSPSWLAHRHGLPAQLAPNVSALTTVLEAVAAKAARAS